MRHLLDRRSSVLGLALLLAACAALQWTPRGPRRTAEVPGAKAVGTEECGVCHEDVQGHEKIAAYHGACESCHGGGSLHAESEEVQHVRFPANADCLACHATGYDTHLQWGTGEHSRAGLLCSDCHNPHSVARRHLRPAEQDVFPHMDAASGLCVECHRDVAAQFDWPSHHPVGEGGLACVSCHDPHEDARVAVGGPNQRCVSCHQDVMGPWLFEHPPVVEACTLCHDPHGAPVQNLLETVQPAICLSCHTLNDLWHHSIAGTGLPGQAIITGDHPSNPAEQIKTGEAMPFLRRCTDCHGAIHGSLTDEHLRH